MSSLMSQARTRVPRMAEAAVERARLSVVPRRMTRASRTPFVTLVSLLALAGVVGLLLFNTSMQQATFRVSSLQQRADALTAKQQSLEMRLEQLRDPQRVATRAKRMGMVPAPDPAFLRLSDGKVLGDPTVATGEVPFRIHPLPPVKPRMLDPKPRVVHVPASDSADSGVAQRGAGGVRGTKKVTNGGSADPSGAGGQGGSR